MYVGPLRKFYDKPIVNNDKNSNAVLKSNKRICFTFILFFVLLRFTLSRKGLLRKINRKLNKTYLCKGEVLFKLFE